MGSPGLRRDATLDAGQKNVMISGNGKEIRWERLRQERREKKLQENPNSSDSSLGTGRRI